MSIQTHGDCLYLYLKTKNEREKNTEKDTEKSYWALARTHQKAS